MGCFCASGDVSLTVKIRHACFYWLFKLNKSIFSWWQLILIIVNEIAFNIGSRMFCIWSKLTAPECMLFKMPGEAVLFKMPGEAVLFKMPGEAVL